MDEQIWAEKTVKKKGEGCVPVLEVAGASGAAAKKNRISRRREGAGGCLVCQSLLGVVERGWGWGRERSMNHILAAHTHSLSRTRGLCLKRF